MRCDICNQLLEENRKLREVLAALADAVDPPVKGSSELEPYFREPVKTARALLSALAEPDEGDAA